jgi:hypothetical protein
MGHVRLAACAIDEGVICYFLLHADLCLGAAQQFRVSAFASELFFGAVAGGVWPSPPAPPCPYETGAFTVQSCLYECIEPVSPWNAITSARNKGPGLVLTYLQCWYWLVLASHR